MAAVFLLATASVWQAIDNRALRARLAGAESARNGLERDRQQRDAEARQAATTERPVGSNQALVALVVLAPQLRGASRLPTVALTGSNGDVAIQLDLEPVDYPAFSAVLLAATGGREVWRADRLVAHAMDNRRALDLRLPATALSPQDYVVRVSGVPNRGASEIVGEYRFSIVR
jgi:hypothetical protein